MNLNGLFIKNSLKYNEPINNLYIIDLILHLKIKEGCHKYFFNKIFLFSLHILIVKNNMNLINLLNLLLINYYKINNIFSLIIK